MNKSSKEFKAIGNASELITYLKSYRRLDKVDSIHHYMKVDSILSIIKSGY